VVVSSFFAQDATNAIAVNAVMKAKRDVFIGLVKLNKAEDVDPRVVEQALNCLRSRPARADDSGVFTRP